MLDLKSRGQKSSIAFMPNLDCRLGGLPDWRLRLDRRDGLADLRDGLADLRDGVADLCV